MNAPDVLDVTSGRVVADANPDATVFGTDLVAIQHSEVPDNVWFYTQDANEEYWSWDDRFDHVRIGGMDGGIKAWDATLWA